jgi:hypothetical protein
MDRDSKFLPLSVIMVLSIMCSNLWCNNGFLAKPKLNTPPAEAEVLLTLDPGSAGEPGPAWPVSWTIQTEYGRNFITTMGHTPESFTDPVFMNHVEDGLAWTVSK